MSDNQDSGQRPLGLAGFDRIWESHPRGGLGVHPDRERDAIAPFIRDDEQVVYRHLAARVYLGGDNVTVHGLVIYLTDRQLIMLTAKRSFRTKVLADAFEYSHLFPTMERADEPLLGSMIWIANIDIIDGVRHVLNFNQSHQRDVFADQFESLARSWHNTARDTPDYLPSELQSPASTVDWSDIETIRQEWPTSDMNPATDLQAWRAGQQVYGANDDYYSMIRAAELMCQAVRHNLYGPGILAGQDLPGAVHSVLFAATAQPPDGHTFTEQARRQTRLALTICKNHGWQPVPLGGDGTLDPLFEGGQYFLFCAAIAPPGQTAADLNTFFTPRTASNRPAPAGPDARNIIQFDPQGPERALDKAMDAASRRPQDYATAFEWCVKAVDRLHDLYVFEQFRNRRPSAADEEIVTALVRSLRFLRRNEPHCDIRDGVIEGTHRLRTISTVTDRSGGDSSLYRQGLRELAEAAPDVDVSDVLWS